MPNEPMNINIEVDHTGDPVVTVSGRDVAIITDREMKAFGMTQSNLREATLELFGNKPKQVFLKDPTPWGNTYNKYGWKPVKRIIVPRAGTPELEMEDVVFASHVFRNDTPNKGKQNIGLTHHFKEEITTSWWNSKKFSVSQDIEYSMSVIGTGASGTTGLSASGSWGGSLTKSKDVTLGLVTGTEINVKPYQHIKSTLCARRCKLDVVVYYDVTLRGDVFQNHDPEVKGHHFWKHDVNALLESGEMPTEFVVEQTISAGFCIDVQLKAEVVTGNRNHLMKMWQCR